VTEKTAKAKQPEKPRQAQKQVQKPAARPADRDREKPKQPNAMARWWRETIGELRKVAWPSVQETRRLTGIVLMVMFVMSAILGLLDFLFSKLISLLVS
jgi:preprotein translocase subunit SecE